MLDPKFIRENLDKVKKGAEKKHIKIDLDKFIFLDNNRKNLQQIIDKKKEEQNKNSESIPKLEGSEKEDKIKELSILKSEIQKIQDQYNQNQKEWKSLLLQVPQIPAEEVPEGKDDSENKEIKTWGEKTIFDFEPKSHIDLMESLDMVDFKRGSKIHGFRGYYLKADGARLSWAIWNYANEFFGKKGFVPMLPPSIVKEENLYGTGHLPNEAEDVYNTQDKDYLIGTSEIPVTGYHSEEVLENNSLPKKYLGFSPCYRREAGSYGKDTKGLIRVHEFYKVEQVILCKADKEESDQFHKWINRNTEEFIESLNIPYHTVLNCGGDLGQGQVKKYDIELWVPGEEKYREISSASCFYDFQSRRFNIKYKNKDGQAKYVYTLNSTAIPTPRILVSLIENFQTKNGEIIIPEPLRKYMDGREKISK